MASQKDFCLNILFVLYGDLNSNTAIPITLFAKHLNAQGHQCALAVPQRPDPSKAILNPFLPAFGFDQILEKNCAIFPQGQRAHIVHACTPRKVIYEFISEYMDIIPTPIAVYLEDNEDWIAQVALKATESSILSFTNKEIDGQLPKYLSHPFESLYFIGLCDLAILIQKKLAVSVPPFIPQKIVSWGYDLEEFQSRSEGIHEVREKYNIPATAKVIVYPGGLNPYTQSAIQDLCEAVIQINDQGIECILLRTGPGPLAQVYPNDEYPKNIIRDLGVIPRSDIPPLLNIADVFVQPGRITLFEDLRLPSKIPEFLAMGKPLLLPNCHIADFFQDSVDAVILKTGESQEIAQKCIEVFSDEIWSGTLGKNARIIAEQHFDIHKQTNLLLEAYQETIRDFESNYSLDESKKIWETANSEGILIALCLRMQIIALNSPALSPDLMRFAIQLIKHQQSRIDALSQRMDSPLEKIKTLEKNIGDLQGIILMQSDELKRAKEKISALEQSSSWKITSPLRWLSRIIR